MESRTRVVLGRREDLGADCARCFGLCCVALAFARSTDFPVDKPAGEPCTHLDEDDACRIHPQLRDRGFKGCTVFDCFGAGQKTSQLTFGARSWRTDPNTRAAMFAAFPIVRRLHELLWYLDQAVALVGTERDTTPWTRRLERVLELSNLPADRLGGVDVDAEYDATRPLLITASELARRSVRRRSRDRRLRGIGPGRDLMGADLSAADLRGACLRGSTLIAADLSGARLSRTDLLGVDLRDADLAGADLTEAIYLTQVQVSGARGDAATTLPVGFDRPAHWR